MGIDYSIKLIKFLNDINKIQEIKNFYENSFFTIYDNKHVNVSITYYSNDINIKFKYEEVYNSTKVPYREFFTGIVKGFENYNREMYRIFPEQNYVYERYKDLISSIRNLAKNYIELD